DPPGSQHRGPGTLTLELVARSREAAAAAVGAVPAGPTLALAKAPAQSRPTLSLRGVTESPASRWLVRQRRAIRVRRPRALPRGLGVCAPSPGAFRGPLTTWSPREHSRRKYRSPNVGGMGPHGALW
ncbi:unnamed protein product, partial [Ixodes hexagonus]